MAGLEFGIFNAFASNELVSRGWAEVVDDHLSRATSSRNFRCRPVRRSASVLRFLLLSKVIDWMSVRRESPSRSMQASG